MGMRTQYDTLSDGLMEVVEVLGGFGKKYKSMKDVLVIRNDYCKIIYDSVVNDAIDYAIDVNVRDGYKKHLQEMFHAEDLHGSFDLACQYFVRMKEIKKNECDSVMYTKLAGWYDRARNKILDFVNKYLAGTNFSVTDRVLAPYTAYITVGTQFLLTLKSLDPSEKGALYGFYAMACQLLQASVDFMQLIGQLPSYKKVCEQFVKQETEMLTFCYEKQSRAAAYRERDNIAAYAKSKTQYIKDMFALCDLLIATDIFVTLSKLAINTVQTELLPEALQNASAAKFIADCFTNRRADNEKEAINLYFHEAKEQEKRESIERRFRNELTQQQAAYESRLSQIVKNDEAFRAATGKAYEQLRSKTNELVDYSNELKDKYNDLLKKID